MIEENWQPLVQENEPMIVMCPEGGELRCFKDGSVVQYLGTKITGFKLPPSIRLFFDTNTPPANADRELLENKNARD